MRGAKLLLGKQTNGRTIHEEEFYRDFVLRNRTNFYKIFHVYVSIFMLIEKN